MTKQPKWIVIGRASGDINPVDYGGGYILHDTTGVYDHEMELFFPPPDGKNENGPVEIRQFTLCRCTFLNGIISDNKFHPDHPAWYNDSLPDIAESQGISLADLHEMFLSSDPLKNAMAWQAVGDYHGYDNLDSYPRSLTRREATKRAAAYEKSLKKYGV